MSRTMLTDFITDFIGTLSISWALWWVLAYAARKPFRDLWCDPLMWVLNVTGALFGMWYWS